jgi:hypothetical protein
MKLARSQGRRAFADAIFTDALTQWSAGAFRTVLSVAAGQTAATAVLVVVVPVDARSIASRKGRGARIAADPEAAVVAPRAEVVADAAPIGIVL